MSRTMWSRSFYLKNLKLKLKIKDLSCSLFVISCLFGCTNSIQTVPSLPSPSVSLPPTQTVTVPAYVDIKAEPKFTTLDSILGDRQPLMVIYNSDNGKSYVWFTLAPMGIYTSDRRAREITSRLEIYRKEKMIAFRWGLANGENIICAVTEQKIKECQIVVTLKPELNPQDVLWLLRCKLERKDDGEAIQT